MVSSINYLDYVTVCHCVSMWLHGSTKYLDHVNVSPLGGYATEWLGYNGEVVNCISQLLLSQFLLYTHYYNYNYYYTLVSRRGHIPIQNRPSCGQADQYPSPPPPTELYYTSQVSSCRTPTAQGTIQGILTWLLL